MYVWEGGVKPLNPAGCYDSVYIYIDIVLHNFVFLPKISPLNSHELIFPLPNLCRNIFDLCQSFVVFSQFVSWSRTVATNSSQCFAE